MAMVGQQDVFQARLGRIASGGVNTMSQVYVGDGERFQRTKNGANNRKRKSLANRSMMFNAFLIGAISMIVARLVLFHTISEDGVYSVQSLGEVGVIIANNLGDIAIAGTLSLAALAMKKLGGQNAILATVAGFGFIMIGEARLLEAAPDFYAALYSPSYAQSQLAMLNATG